MSLWNRFSSRRGTHPVLSGDPDFGTAPQIRKRYFRRGVPRTAVEDKPKPAGLRNWFGRGRKDAARSDHADTPIRKVDIGFQPQNALNPAEQQLLSSLFGTDDPVAAEKTPAPAAQRMTADPSPKKRKKLDRGDLTIAALGITLAAICAVFPWYIFFNQEKFGVKEFVFDGGRANTPASHLAYRPGPVGKPFNADDLPTMNLDFFPTATVVEEHEPIRPVPASEQPFPSDLVNFRLVHVANGRAMIADDDGLWVVQPGSRLPDASQVAAIEQRNGQWVLVTSLSKVLKLER